MDNIGIEIRKRLGNDGKIEVRMVETGKSCRMQPVDAREAVASRRGQLVGKITDHRAGYARPPVLPDLTEAEIVSGEESITTPEPQVRAHPGFRPGSGTKGPLPQPMPASRAARSPLPAPDPAEAG